MVTSFDGIREALKAQPVKKRIGVVVAQDKHTLDAVLHASADGLVKPVLLGDKQAIAKVMSQMGESLENVEIIDIASPEGCAIEAASLVRQGMLDCVMKGKIETGTLMKVLVNKEHGIRRSDTMSMIAFFESPYYHKLFAVTDAGLLTYPTIEQKRDAIANAVSAFQKLGLARPKIGVLTAIEHVNPKMKETVEADQLKQMSLSGEITGCIVEGPISYDLAMSTEAGKIKGYDSPVAGDADILVVPDLITGNTLTKSLLYTGGAKAAGAIVGATVPLVLTSRSTSMEDKYMSILLNALIGKI